MQLFPLASAFWEFIWYKSIPYTTWNQKYAMCILMLLLYLHLDSHSFYLLFMFLLLHILFWCLASAYWDDICSYSSHFFLFMFFLPWGQLGKKKKKKKENSIYRHSPNHLTFLPHLLKHSSYYPSALCFVSTLKLDWWESAWGTERQLFLYVLLTVIFFRNSFYKHMNSYLLSAIKATEKLSPTWFQNRDY